MLIKNAKKFRKYTGYIPDIYRLYTKNDHRLQPQIAQISQMTLIARLCGGKYMMEWNG